METYYAEHAQGFTAEAGQHDQDGAGGSVKQPQALSAPRLLLSVGMIGTAFYYPSDTGKPRIAEYLQDRLRAIQICFDSEFPDACLTLILFSYRHFRPTRRAVRGYERK